MLLFLTLNNGCGEKPKVSSPSNDPLPPLISTPFSEEELVPYKAQGTASINGSAFLIMENQKQLHQEGALVLLVPVSKYTEEWFHKYVIQEGECRSLTDPSKLPSSVSFFVPPGRCTLAYAVALDERILPYVRNTKTDTAGRFALVNLPPGEYFVAVRISSPEGQYFLDAIAHSRVKLSADQHLTNVGASRKVDRKQDPSSLPQ